MSKTINAEAYQNPKIGDIVHYVGTNGTHYPSIVTEIENNEIDIVVFATDGHITVAGATEVEYDAECSNGSWHWPE